jgi:hypothetical protein
MADAKISQLTSATALAGTEVVPVVQGGSTKKATIDQILTPAAGKGVDFSANTHAPGMTSELLNWYEEGNWTPDFSAWTTAPTSVFDAKYTRIGRQVTVVLTAQNGNCAAANQKISGLPFTAGVASVAVLRDLSGGTLASIATVPGATSTVDSIQPVNFTGVFWSLSATYFV